MWESMGWTHRDRNVTVLLPNENCCILLKANHWLLFLWVQLIIKWLLCLNRIDEWIFLHFNILHSLTKCEMYIHITWGVLEVIWLQRLLLPKWLNINLSMYKWLHPLLNVRWNYLSIPKGNRWIFSFHTLPDLWLLIHAWLKLHHVSKRGPKPYGNQTKWKVKITVGILYCMCLFYHITVTSYGRHGPFRWVSGDKWIPLTKAQ